MKKFTLIEVVLALLVAAVGIIGTMALMPLGMEKNKESVWNLAASDSADQFLHSCAAKLRADWNYTRIFPNTIPTMSDENIIWSEENFVDSNSVDIKFSTVNSSDHFDLEVNQDGMFKVTQVTAGQYQDFTGEIRAWKELITIEDPRLNGDIMPWAILYDGNPNEIGLGFIFNEDYQLKYNAGSEVTPGNFGAVNFTTGQGGGARAYQSFIENGGINASVGDQFFPETGNMAGPTVQGVQSRLAQTPYIRIPVVGNFPNGSSERVTIIGFLPFRLNEVSGQGNSAATVTATYIGEDRNGDGASRASERIMLKAEVSWPFTLPYTARQKSIYSLGLFKGGQLISLGEEE